MRDDLDDLTEQLEEAYLELQEAHLTLPLFKGTPTQRDKELLDQVNEATRRYYRLLEKVTKAWERAQT
jgi:hypothetical protein